MSLLYVLLLGWLGWRGYQAYSDSPVRVYYFPALVLKLLAGIGLGLLYSFYYEGGDTFNYHQDARALSELAWNAPLEYAKVLAGAQAQSVDLHYASGQERALLAAKLFSFFYLFTGDNYWIAASYVSFLAFLSLFRMVHRLVSFRPRIQKAAALAFLFWPSFAFWTSGLLKESLAVICISFIVSSCLPFIMAGKKFNWLEVIASVCLMVLLFKLKYYYAGILGPVLGCLLLAIWLGRTFALKRAIVWLSFAGLLSGGFLIATQLHPNLYISRFLDVWVENYYLLSAASAEGGYVAYRQLEPEWGSILSNAPRAIIAGLYAPLFQVDFTNPLRLAASAENIVLLLLSIISFIGWILKCRGKLSLPAFALIIYILIFALIMGIAAPNYGSLSRYRVSYQPFFVLLVLIGCQYFMAWMREKRHKKEAAAT